MALSNAERQRNYRERHKPLRNEPEVAPEPVDPCLARVLELEEEVRHLKAELAHRPHVLDVMAGPSVNIAIKRVKPSFNSRPFTPVPKVSPSR